MIAKGEKVKKLKEENAPEIDITRAVAELKVRKHVLENKVISESIFEEIFLRKIKY